MDKVTHNYICSLYKDCSYYKQFKRLQAEYDDLHLTYAGCKTANSGLQELNEKLQAELQRYKDIAKKGLEEFKDVGGCWGCGLQLQLNQDIEDIKKLKAENERLKEENEQHKKEKQILHERLYCYAYEKDCHIVCKQQNCILKNGYTYRNTLKEIKEIAEQCYDPADKDNDPLYSILDKINEVIGAEE